jgi:hypothetical protein
MARLMRGYLVVDAHVRVDARFNFV